MKNIILTFLLFLNLSMFSQNIQNYSLETPLSDHFSDFIELDDYYLISGIQLDKDSIGNNLLKKFYIKIGKNGVNSNIYYFDTINYDEMLWSTVHYNGYLYNIAVDNYNNSVDSGRLVIIKCDTSFNVLQRTVFNDVKESYFTINANTFLNNSSLTIDCSSNNKTFFVEINLDSLKTNYIKKFNIDLFADDFYIDKNNNYILIGSINMSKSTVLIYDSAFNFIDTSKILPKMGGNSNIMEYNDSMYIVTGFGYDFSSTPFIPFQQFVVQVLDANFNTDLKRTFYHDSTNANPGYVKNFVKNDNNEYFIGGFLRKHFLSNNDSAGILIVKIDSNFNKIWQKHIPGNDNCKSARLMPTSDGGVVFIYAEFPPNNSNGVENSYFMKIGPNGEVSSIINLGNLKTQKLSLYPNPASSVLNIELKSPNLQITNLKILNAQGKIFIGKKVNSNKSKINISNLNSGVYFIEAITNSGERVVEKFVKE